MEHRGIDPEIWETVVNGEVAERLFICEREPVYFLLYYFDEYFDYALADFHYDYIENFKKLVFGEYKMGEFIGFRESGKTSITKLLLIWVICFKHKKYINYDSYERDNSESALFDIVVALQGNELLISDFGHLYHKPKKKSGDQRSESTQKRISNFITNNKVRVAAFSTQESTRGRITAEARPDFFVFDDVENNKTKDSPVITAKIISHIDEARTGFAVYGCGLLLGNLIIDDGTVATMAEKIKQMGNGFVMNVPVVTPDGAISWPDKYVKTDAEAAAANRYIENQREYKVSLEAKKREFRDEIKGDSLFETEMMNNPAKAGDYYFDRRKVDRAIETALKYPPLKDNGGLKMWELYNPAHRYSAGGDTSEGIGRDANASVFIDHSPRPAKVVASYENNELSPDLFGIEFARQGRIFGECILVPEINNTGYATVRAMVNPEQANYSNVYQRQVKEDTTRQMKTTKWGWRSTSGTKADVMSNFKTAFEDDQLEVFDIGLLTEMKFFKKSDALAVIKKPDVTRHYDKLRAAALAWEGRHLATNKKEVDTIYKAPKREPYKA